MKSVLVLGGSGHVGARLGALLRARGQARTVVVASRNAGADGLRLDARDEPSLARAVRGMDAVVNCVAGSVDAIEHGALALARAARAARTPQVVHLSSMAVYGDQEGGLDEGAALRPARGWYARAKQQAETAMASLADSGTRVTVLRPGCIWGPGSELWVGRIARWLAAGRLGDLGEAGDGWSNGVHVDDVCQAVMLALGTAPQTQTQAQAWQVFNLAAPDSPRWNDWFIGLGLALGTTPLRRITPLQLRLDAWALGPALHVSQRLLRRWGHTSCAFPEPLSPGLLRLWQRHLRLDSEAVTQGLGLAWTPYATSLQQSAAWCLGRERHALQARPA